MAPARQPSVGHLGRSVGGLIVAIALTIACDAQHYRAEELQRRTERNGATAGDISGPERSTNGVRFTWEIRSLSSWDQYRTSVIEEFKRDFAIVRSDDSSLVLSRWEGGDVYRLEFQAAAALATAQVHVCSRRLRTEGIERPVASWRDASGHIVASFGDRRLAVLSEVTMTEPPLSVLFLFTGSSARSQIAEAILRQLSLNQIEVHSAGSAPQSEAHAMAKAVLESKYGIDTSELHPKSMDRFRDRRFDYMITGL